MLLTVIMHLDCAVLLALAALAASLLSSLVVMGRELKAAWVKS